MSKKKGLVVNKAAEIRRVASLLVSQGKLPRPKAVREHLGRRCIVVTSQQVSMALSNTEFAYRRNQILKDQSVQTTLKEVLHRLGSVERAIASLSIFRETRQPETNQSDRNKAEEPTMNEMEKIVTTAVLGHLAKNGKNDVKITRNSENEYDLKLEGEDFSAWLPLLAIKEMTCWPSEEIAGMTDYPSMASEGDWSGVRDTDPEKVMRIFKKFVVQPMEKLFGKGA